jgi:outer membrane protein assembly factor BamA
VFALILVAFSSVIAPQGGGQEVVAAIRIQGNLITPDEEVRQLAAIELQMPLASGTVAEITERLRATGRFRRVEVLKRFASLADPSQIVLVVIVDEGRVSIESTGQAGAPARVVRRGGLQLMYLPLIDFEDGYGFSYGVRVARPGPFGRRSLLSFPLTWGGDKRVAVEVDRNFVSGPVDRVDVGASLSRRRHPFYEQNDDRRRLWMTAGRDLTFLSPSLRASATAAWEQVGFLDREDSFAQTGADLVLDTRVDRTLPRNAVYARAAWERSHLPNGAVNRRTLDGRGYLALPRGNVLVLRAMTERADRPLLPYLKSMLGGMPNLRGFRRGVATGDRLVAGSVEARLPLTSPISTGQFGLMLFTDAAATYDVGERFQDQKLKRSIGAGVWFSAAFVRLNVAVAHGLGGSTRVHFSTGISP